MTLTEYAAWADAAQIEDRRTELIDGVVVESPFHHMLHGWVNTTVAGIHSEYLRRHPIGYGVIGSGLVLSPDTVQSVDVAVFRNPFPAATSAEGWATDMPLLGVEIWSPWDTPATMGGRVRRYLAAGVPLVWTLSPEEQRVGVHRPDSGVEYLEGHEELSAPELPGFRCTISRFFPPIE